MRTTRERAGAGVDPRDGRRRPSASVVDRARERERKERDDGGGRKRERRAAAAIGTHLVSMNTLAISVRSAFRFFACGVRESTRATVRETPRVTAANRGSRRRRGVNQSIGGEIGGDSADVSRREARVSQSVRARTVLEGVIFLALASAFIALRVSLSPFASRYASTAGTRSAAFALIAQLSVSWRLRRAATRCAPTLRRNEGGVSSEKGVLFGLVFSGELVVLARVLVTS